MKEESFIELPIKKRKLDNGSAVDGASGVNTKTQSQILSDDSEDLIDAAVASTDTLKDPNEKSKDSTQFAKEFGESTNNWTECAEDASEFTTVSEDKFRNLVTDEELERLRQFHVLDEVKSNDEDSIDENSDDSDGKSVELPDEEIEMMLEADLPDAIKGAPKTREKQFVTRRKTVLEEKGINHFEVLPLDWIMVRHMSGMPIYMQRSTRVCTLSKPYFLGKNNTRRHDIPISAIPCLSYKRALEEEEKQKEIDRRIEEQIRSGVWAKSNEGCPQTVLGGNQTNSNISNSTETLSTNQPQSAFVCQRKVLSNDQQQLASNDQHTHVSANEPLEAVGQNNPKSTSQQMESSDQNPQNSTPGSKDKKKSKSRRHQKSKSKGKESSVSTDLQSHECNDRHDSKDQVLSDFKDKIAQDSKDGQIPTLDSQNSHTVDGEMPQFSCPDKDTKENLLSDILLEEAAIIKREILDEVPENECSVSNVTVPGEQNPNEKDKQNNSTTSASETIPLNRQPVILPGGIVMPPPRVETINTSWKTQHLTAEQINDYCKKLFKFKTVNIMHFKRWADRRKYTKARKTLQYPTLPEGTKLITIPAQPSAPGQENGGKSTKRDWVMNMNDRSYLSVFHEYVRRALQKQPVYHFRQLENASQPYQAIVYIGGMQYGVGYGSSKRQAKSAAARASIHILIPEMKDEFDAPEASSSDKTQPDFHEFFDLVSIEDPRISEFCAATCEPSPHATLRTCLLRNFGAGDRHIHTEMKKLEFQKIELTMKVGKHTASVICKNKKTAKQRASQAILQALHPHVRSWGSLLRLYGSKSVKSCKEKKLEEQQITLLQDKARHNEPNYAVLEKLRQEMRKLRERDEAVVPIGTLLVKESLPTHSGSNLNNVDL